MGTTTQTLIPIWEQIKQKVHIGSLVTLTGDEFKCPHEGNKTGFSAQFYPHSSSWYCHKCKHGGDVITLYEVLNHIDRSEAMKLLAIQCGLTVSPRHQEYMENRQKVLQLYDEISLLFEAELQNYQNGKYIPLLMKERGFTKETILSKRIGLFTSSVKKKLLDTYPQSVLRMAGFLNPKMHFGFEHRIVFPYLDPNRKPTFFIYRALKDEPDFSAERKYVKQYTSELEHVEQDIYGRDTLYLKETKNKPLIITEGITDAISVHQANYPCLSPVTIRFRKLDYNLIAKYCKHFRKIVVIMDNEVNQEGLKGAIQTVRLLLDSKLPVYLGTIPRPNNIEKIDLNDYLQADTAEKRTELLDHLVENATEGFEFIANQIKMTETGKEREDYLKDLLTRCIQLPLLKPKLRKILKETIDLTASDIKMYEKIVEEEQKAKVIEDSLCLKNELNPFESSLSEIGTDSSQDTEKILLESKITEKTLIEQYLVNDPKENQIYTVYYSNGIEGKRKILAYCSIVSGMQFINPLMYLKNNESSSEIFPKIEYELTVQHCNHEAYPDPITLCSTKANAFPDLLKEKNFVGDTKELNGIFAVLWNHLLNIKKITIEIKLVTDGFFVINDIPTFKNGEKLITPGAEHTVTKEQLVKACNCLAYLHDTFFQHSKEKFTSQLLWGLAMPTGYIRKMHSAGRFIDKYHIPILHNHGSSNTGKSTVHDQIIQPMFGRSDPELSFNSIKNDARLRNVSGFSGFSVELKEISPIYDKNNEGLLEMFKSLVESQFAGFKYVENNTKCQYYPAIANFFITINYKKSIDPGFDRRNFYIGFSKDDRYHIQLKEKEFNLYLQEIRDVLPACGEFLGVWYVNHYDDAVTLNWRDFAIKAFSEMFSYADLEVPIWIQEEWYDSETIEDSKIDESVVVRSVYINRIRNLYFKEFSKLTRQITIEDDTMFGGKKETVEELPTTSQMLELLLKSNHLPEFKRKSWIIFPPWFMNEIEGISGITSLIEFGRNMGLVEDHVKQLPLVKIRATPLLNKRCIKVEQRKLYDILDNLDEFEEEEADCSDIAPNNTKSVYNKVIELYNSNNQQPFKRSKLFTESISKLKLNSIEYNEVYNWLMERKWLICDENDQIAPLPIQI